MTAKRSRNGSTSRRASCASTRIERKSPEMNAASASGTPKIAAPSPAVTSAADTATMRNVSCSSRTPRSRRGNTQSWTVAASATKRTALPNAMGALPASPGESTTVRIVAATRVTTSCKTDHTSSARAEASSSVRRFERVMFTITIELESPTARPSVMAPSPSLPSATKTSAPAKVTSATCAGTAARMPSGSRRNARRSSSIPTSNSSRTTPTSARTWIW